MAVARHALRDKTLQIAQIRGDESGMWLELLIQGEN